MTTFCTDGRKLPASTAIVIASLSTRNKQFWGLDICFNIVYTKEKDALEMFMLDWCVVLDSWSDSVNICAQQAMSLLIQILLEMAVEVA